MHKLRKAIAAKDVRLFDTPIVDKDDCPSARPTRLREIEVERFDRRQTHQRNEERFRVDEAIATALWRDEQSVVRVINLSSNGLQIETEREAEIAEEIEIVLGNCDPIVCAVRWIKGERIGLEYDCETRILADAGVIDYVIDNVERVLTKSGAADDRRIQPERRGVEKRHGLSWLGALKLEDGSAPVLLRNISKTGALLHHDKPLSVSDGDWCELDLSEAGCATATVKWAVSGEIGIMFDEEFDVARLVCHSATEIDSGDERVPEAYSDTANAAASILARKPQRDEEGNVIVETGADADSDHGNRVGEKLTLTEIYETLYPDGCPIGKQSDGDASHLLG